MSDVSCVIFYAGGMLQTIEFPWVALNVDLFEGPLRYSTIFGKTLFTEKSSPGISLVIFDYHINFQITNTNNYFISLRQKLENEQINQ
jgi:hypothetical protein